MKKITRLEAYRTIYAQARAQGLDNDQLHDMLAEWGFVPASLSKLSAPKLHEVLKCFGLNLFVSDHGSVAQLAIISDVKADLIFPYIKKRFNKDSIFQLTNQQARSTLAVIHNYNKKDQK